MKNPANTLASIKITEWTILTLLVLLPIAYLPGFGSYAAARYFFFGIGAIILTLTTSLIWLRLPEVPKAYFRHRLNFGVLAYFVAFLVAALFSQDQATSFWSSFQRTDGVFTILFLSIFALSVFTAIAHSGKNFINKLLKSSLIGAVLLSIFIMLSPGGIGHWFQSSRLGATTGNSSVAAAYILWNIFFALYLFLSNEQRNERIKSGLALLLMIVSPLFINWHSHIAQNGILNIVGEARAVILGLFVGLIIAGLTYLTIGSDSKQKLIGRVGIFIVSILLAVGAIQLLTPTTKIHQSFTQIASETRFIFWKIAWQSFLEKPVVGWGPAAFNIPYHQHFNPEMLVQRFGGEMWADKAHNIILETLSGGGIVLFAGLIFLLVSIVWSLIRAYRNNQISRLTAGLMIGALVAWFVQAQFIFESLLSLSMLFLLAGISYSFAYPVAASAHPIRLTTNKKYAFGTISALTLLIFILAIALPYHKSRYMNETYNTSLPSRTAKWTGLRGISPMGNGYDSVLMFRNVYEGYESNLPKITQGDPKFQKAVVEELNAIEKYLYDQSKIQTKTPEFDILGARLAYFTTLLTKDSQASHLERAQEMADRGLKLSPTNPAIYLIAAKIAVASKNYEQAKQLMEQGLELEPKYSLMHDVILWGAKQMKDEAYYQSSLKRAQDLIPNYQPPT